jgi:hypothetical protein
MTVTIDCEPFHVCFVVLCEDANLEPRILSNRRRPNDNRTESLAKRNRRPTVVIADSGADAEVLVFSPGEAVARGTRFQYRGITWVITGRRRDSRVLVAEPTYH